MGKLKVIAEPGSHEVTLEREFDAPRELIFKAYTDKALISQWWGLRSSAITIDQFEAKKGGVWRFIERDANGDEYAFSGVFHQVKAPERLVYTFEYEPMEGHVMMETITLETRDGKTIVHDSSVFQTVADRDGMIQSGMEWGANESMDRLEELLATM
ncbi:MAG: activator of Hsp90 ATPase 1 family protein [Chloroflexi bacterium OLB15]|nr:MAG: activator of Hsp90 ATPase 1 family protein [Chloroflexi bacterium OLB15]